MIFPTQELDDTTLTARKEYSIDFTEQQNKFLLTLHYNEVNSYIFVNGDKIYKLKAKDKLLVVCYLFNLYTITSQMFGSEALFY